MAAMLILAACSSPESKKSAAVNEKLNGFSKGTYGYDLEFLKKNNVETLELRDSISGARFFWPPVPGARDDLLGVGRKGV